MTKEIALHIKGSLGPIIGCVDPMGQRHSVADLAESWLQLLEENEALKDKIKSVDESEHKRKELITCEKCGSQLECE